MENHRAKRLLERVPSSRIAGGATNVLVGGRFQAKQVLLPDVVLGAKNVELLALLVNSRAPDAFPGSDGVLGLSVLNARRVHFDLEKKTVSWE